MAIARSGSFVDNMRLPIHRWFRYSAGFSAAWEHEMEESQAPRAAARRPPVGGGGVSENVSWKKGNSVDCRVVNVILQRARHPGRGAIN